MDHSEGVQIPRGILPGVSVLKPGLALCLKHSQVDKRYIDSHIEQLNQYLPKALYPAFMLKDTANGTLSNVVEMLQRLRVEALRENRVYFVWSPFFAARLPALDAEVDHLFFYTPGLSAPLLLAERINNKRVPHEEKEILIVQRIPLRKEERKVIHITLPEGVDAEEASRIVSEAVAARYSGRIDIELADKHEQ